MSKFTRKIINREEIVEYIMERFGYSLEDAIKEVEERLGPEENSDD